MKKLVLVGALVVAALLVAIAGVLWFAYGKEVILRISQAKLQEALDARFPIEKTYLVIFTIRYANPVVKLEEGADRIHVGLNASTIFLVNDKAYGGSALVSGSIAYDPTTGEFHLKDSRLEKMSITGIPEKYTDKVNDVGSLLLRQYLDRKPLYRLKGTDVKQSLAKLVLKRVQVKNGELEVTMGIGP